MTARLPLVHEETANTSTEVVDHVAVARLYGEPLFSVPQDLYIPPDALEIFLETFEGPLDVLLYLIRKQNFNILDIPMAAVTRQYLDYIEEIRNRNLELAAEYLLMAAMLIEIKSRMLLPPKKSADGQEAEDPRAELARRLREYEQIKLAAQNLLQLPQSGRDFFQPKEEIEKKIGKVGFDQALFTKEVVKAKAPGMKYKHYAPKAKVYIIKEKEDIENILTEVAKSSLGEQTKALICFRENYGAYLALDFTEKIIIGDKSNIKEAIRNLYRILRDCDILGIENIFIEETEEKGLGFSYMNRLKKAGSYNFLKRS